MDRCVGKAIACEGRVEEAKRRCEVREICCRLKLAQTAVTMDHRQVRTRRRTKSVTHHNIARTRLNEGRVCATAMMIEPTQLAQLLAWHVSRFVTLTSQFFTYMSKFEISSRQSSGRLPDAMLAQHIGAETPGSAGGWL
jgi:hypothetical protein